MTLRLEDFAAKMSDASATVYEILGIYALILIIIGSVGNLLTFVICNRPKLRKNTCFVFLSIICLIDIFTLYTWNLSNFIVPFFKYYHESQNLIWCKISVFIQFSSLQSSAWLLVAMTVERYLSIRIRNWYQVYFNTKKAVVVSIIVIFIIFVFNLHLLISNGYHVSINDTRTIECYDSNLYPLFPMWDIVHNFTYSMVPFVLLATFNSLLIYKTVSKKCVQSKFQFSSAPGKRKAMTITIMLVTLAFFILTAPSAIAGGYFFSELYETVSGRIILCVCESLTFSFHSFNFIVFLLFNKQFKREFMDIVTGFRRKRIGPFTVSSIVTTA